MTESSMSQQFSKIVPYGYVHSTVCWQEDLGKFPNCLNSIPNENLGLKKENKQNFFCKYI